MAQIRFTTDSAADLPRSLREALDIRVLPFPIAIDDREYQDGEDAAPEEFYARIQRAAQIPTHAQLTPFQFQESFEGAWRDGCTDLIHTSINAKATSTYDNALRARELFYEEFPEAREAFHIYIVDSGTYTMAYGWAVAEGARMAAAGAGAGEVVAYIEDWVARARVLFTPLDLRFAKRSGRVCAAAAFVGEALGLKPIMTFENGESKILAKVRGEKNVIPAMLELCGQSIEDGAPYLLIRADNAPMFDKLRESAAAALGRASALEYSIGGVIAINAGPNLVGMIYREKL